MKRKTKIVVAALVAMAMGSLAWAKKDKKGGATTPPQHRVVDDFADSDDPAQNIFKTFGGCGVQIWINEWGEHEPTFRLNYKAGCIVVGNVGWWGGAFGCYDNGISNGAKFNLRPLKKITLEAKASKYGTIYFNLDGDAKNELDLTPEYKQYEINVPVAKSATEVLFMIGGIRDLNDEGTKVYIRNIAFYDKDGNEIVPVYN